MTLKIQRAWKELVVASIAICPMAVQSQAIGAAASNSAQRTDYVIGISSKAALELDGSVRADIFVVSGGHQHQRIRKVLADVEIVAVGTSFNSAPCQWARVNLSVDDARTLDNARSTPYSDEICLTRKDTDHPRDMCMPWISEIVEERLQTALKNGNLGDAFREIFGLAHMFGCDNRLTELYGQTCEAFQLSRTESLRLTPGASCHISPSTTLMFEYGLRLLDAGRYDESARYFGRVVLSNPSIDESLFFLGESLLKSEKEVADSAYKSFAGRHPDHPLSVIALARLQGNLIKLPRFWSLAPRVCSPQHSGRLVGDEERDVCQ